MTIQASPLVERAGELLRQLAGPDALLRPDQAAAIEAVAGYRRHAVVQRTGFGESAPSTSSHPACCVTSAPSRPLVVSPLLATHARPGRRRGPHGRPVGERQSTNLDEWAEIALLAAGATSGR